MKVYMSSFEEDPIMKDTAVIKNGKFVFNGSVPVPVFVQLSIDKTKPGEKSSQRNWTMTRFYLENSNINYSGDIATLPAYFYKKDTTERPAVIVGSTTQKVFENFNEGNKSDR